MSRLTIVSCLLIVAACATSPGSATADGSAAAISADEMETVRNLDGFEAVRRLRPTWLQTRGVASFNQPGGIKVYVNGMIRGGVSELRTLRARNIETMGFLTAREATTRFGGDHSDGAILVRLKR